MNLQKVDLPKTSGFDPNAILRGAQLTLVGGALDSASFDCAFHDR